MANELPFPNLDPASEKLGFDASPALDLEVERLRRLAALGTLTSGIAHEFNNILTPVMAYAEMAAAAPTDTALVARALDKVVEGIRRATGISEAILALATAAPAAGGRASTSIECGVTAALRSLADLVEGEAMPVRSDLAPDLEAAIEPTVLHQVLVNLLINARHAMPVGTGSISIRGCRRSSPGNSGPSHIEIEIEDSGSGIVPSLLPRVFEPFVSGRVAADSQPDGARSGSRRGHGLGLAICRQLVERAGGSIAVRSTLGLGTCFTVRLPEAAEVAKSRAA